MVIFHIARALPWKGDRKGRKASLGLPQVTHTDLEFLKHENVYSI